MDEIAIILNLVFRLGLTSEQYRVLRKLAETFYDVPRVEQMPNAVAWVLHEYGVRGCRYIADRVIAEPNCLDNIDNLDQLLFR